MIGCSGVIVAIHNYLFKLCSWLLVNSVAESALMLDVATVHILLLFILLAQTVGKQMEKQLALLLVLAVLPALAQGQ